MKRFNNGDSVRWFSDENDWNTQDGATIAVWAGCIIKDEEKSDFVNFIKDEADSDVEVVGNFETADGTATAVFLVKSNIPRFSIWRFRVPGIRWWYDAFWQVNGGLEVADEELMPILDKLGLKINEVSYIEEEIEECQE